MTTYSFQDDPAVPSFDLSQHMTVMDAQCGLCAKGASWIARNDTKHEFTIIPLQSDLGRALMTHYRMDADDPTSWLYLSGGHAHTSLDAFLNVADQLLGTWNRFSPLRILPKPVRDFLYTRVARNRYKFFGKTDLCNLPDPAVQQRLLK